MRLTLSCKSASTLPATIDSTATAAIPKAMASLARMPASVA